MLGATNDENDVELDGEKDDEDMEDGDVGFDDGSAQVNRQGAPKSTVTTHRPY